MQFETAIRDIANSKRHRSSGGRNEMQKWYKDVLLLFMLKYRRRVSERKIFEKKKEKIS